MQITDILAQMGGLRSVARELGVNESQVATGADALIPAILGGFKRQAQSQSGGADVLGSLLGQFGGGLLDDVLAPQPTHVERGDAVLGQIFGSKDVSRAVADKAAAQSGLDASLLRKMLPMVAMLVAGYMQKQGGEGAARAAPGGALGVLGSLLGGQSAGQASGLHGIVSMLDLDGDGNPFDDILQMVGKAMR
jgi:hypothetical protein